MIGGGVKVNQAALMRVEQQRVELEANVAELRKSMRHWQTLETDYEGLKEELITLPDKSSTSEILRVVRDFGPQLVDDKELCSLAGKDLSVPRRPSQIADLLSKRIEYVARNVETIKKQLSDAQSKANALLAEDPQHIAEASLPLTEITEELDEDDHVISSRVETSVQAAPRLIDVLQKAGVKDIAEVDRNVLATDGHASTLECGDALVRTDQGIPLEQTRYSSVGGDSSSRQVTRTTVSDGTADPPETRQISASTQPISSKKATNTPAEITLSTAAGSFPRNPDDTPEHAALRQEMLEYGMGEVGAIVAELDLEDNATDISYDDYDEDEDSFDSDYDEDEDYEEEESDDDTGKAKHPIISERYRRKMEQLEKKLGMKSIQNLGPAPDLPKDVQEALDRPVAAEAARKAALARADALAKGSENDQKDEQPSATKAQPKKKRVAFAESLDIAPETTMRDVEPSPVKKMKTGDDSAPSPVLETIVERGITQPSTNLSAPNPPLGALSTKKTSRFKSTRSGNAEPPPFGTDLNPTSTSRTSITSPIVERSPPSNKSTWAPNPDDLDASLHARQIATEYRTLHNRMIHAQGGFVGDGATDNYGDAIAPLEEIDSQTGKARKMSRFKAARLK